MERLAGAPRRQPQRLQPDSAPRPGEALWPSSADQRQGLPAKAVGVEEAALELWCGGGEGDLQRPLCFSTSLRFILLLKPPRLSGLVWLLSGRWGGIRPQSDFNSALIVQCCSGRSPLEHCEHDKSGKRRRNLVKSLAFLRGGADINPPADGR